MNDTDRINRLWSLTYAVAGLASTLDHFNEDLGGLPADALAGLIEAMRLLSGEALELAGVIKEGA